MESMSEVRVQKKKWIYFMRQLLVCSGVWSLFFIVGQFLGAPTVFVPQLRRDSVNLDNDMATWLYSVFGLAAVPWVFIFSVLIRLYGLRITYITSCVGLLISYVLLFFCTSPLEILISEIFFGIGYATPLTTGIIIISDYSSPKYRGVFLSIKSASLFWGIWSTNAIGTFFHWKYITYSGFICSAYTFSIIFCPESPQWLASKGRYDECRKAYFWLQGQDETTEGEVRELIASQTRDLKSVGMHSHWSGIPNAWRTVTSKEFYGPLLLTTLLIVQYQLAGKFVCVIYVVDILKKMTNSESAAYMGMLLLDFITLISMYIGSFLSKILNRRTLYLTSAFSGVAFLLIISLYLYLVSLKLITENVFVSVVLLTCYSIAMGCGLMILNISMYAELIPLKFKTIMFLIAAVLFYASLFCVLKISPYIFKSLGLHGAFFSYGVSAGFCTVLLYKFLPETKDKTLLEIEKYFKTPRDESQERERLNTANYY